MKKLSKKQLKNLYNADYVSRHQKHHSVDKRRLKRLFKFINFNKNDFVLDVGCGNGLLLDYIFNKINFYYGVDFSKDFIEVAINRKKENKIKNAKFICKDISNFYKDFKNKFDKIFALDFVEHIYDEDFKEIFTSSYKSLKINGELYIHTPNGNYFLEIFKNKNLLLKQFPEHVAIRTARQYKIFLEKIGFTDIKIIYLSHYIKFLSFFDFLKYIPFVGMYFKARLLIICKK